MRNGMLHAAAALGLAMVAGCSTFGTGDPSVVSATALSNTIRFVEGDLNNASAVANRLCGQHGKTASLQTVTPVEGRQRLGQFACV